MPVNSPQYYEKNVVPQQMREAGFKKERTETMQIDHQVCEKEDGGKWKGSYDFMTSPNVGERSTEGRTDDE